MATRDRIFLAHASEDKPQVRQLYQQLKERGFSPWLDAVDLIPGQNWEIEIPKAIKEAAVCLACFSKRSVAKRSYVQREFRYALNAYVDLPPGSIYLIPVRLDDCEVPDLRIPDLELKLRSIHWVDLFKDEGFEKLVDAIELNVKPSSAPSSHQRKPFEVFKDIDAPWCPEMIQLPAGKFLMGSPAGIFRGEKGRRVDEGPQHEVIISQPFALGRYAVTFEEFDHFCNQTGRDKPTDEGWGRDRHPVINLSHEDARAYCVWLSMETKTRYQLPTEAMWEYACRAGTTTPFSFGDNVTTDQANYIGHRPYAGAAEGEFRGKTVPVGTLPANPWGLHEMHGNVWEWVSDWHGFYSSGSVIDPKGPATGSGHVIRGGSWGGLAAYSRSAGRSAGTLVDRDEDVGFRCARVQDV